uniref:Uncharacterized protein n=1 Tax=Coccolithus braarudii TaxID=221442 RepID=A0A7S0Q9E8_9EUKA|mmetsp:Transcript_49881/g.106618  ORF Transcript_49881/g.106618 Transcript_49881/m.106618 type:complete len:255 (+) Transcript_49881:231-995(+)|eukprot:CAMPEP_0183348816 /NCGR_PEP_ID=MMETSP0164_2-20130417/13209_1 /TAXON_ID=221442 /ORGANISM="Coccolithus pelagicus ssp braarudi, Strain PLY182g" /LENGTH=254 /DNA_ID=CAMNT_0025520463 /DNA_START=165 /DNA_END=929 /DNA_ORIENTATION=+
MAPPPRYQLIKGDKYNITLGVLVASILAACKEVPGLPRLLQWQLNAYTNWNITFLWLRLVLRQDQWDPFLAVNSVGIFSGFRTAMCQGIDDNMRLKLKSLGVNLPRPVFLGLDHMLHTLPPMLLLTKLIRKRERIPMMNAVYSLVLSTWFSFRQSAKLDASGIYVPHPWLRTWISIIVCVFGTPLLVDACISKNRRRALVLLIAMVVPYLTARLDPKLRKKYHFEFQLQRLKETSEEQEDAMHRTMSAAAFVRS